MAKRSTSRRSTAGRSARAKSTRSSRTSSRRRTGARERISPRGDTRFVRRGPSGQFTESDDAGRSLRMDRRKKAKTKAKSGYGDRGDRPRSRAR